MLDFRIKKNLFQAKTYREFIKLVIDQCGNERGYKKKLADSASCQPAYFSQVMAGLAELTPEQADGLCIFWDLNELESEYFFNLVLINRAGTLALRRRLEIKLLNIKNSWEKETLSFGKSTIKEVDRSNLYYSSWLNSAIHLLITIPGMQTVDALVRHLHKSQEEIYASIKELELAGLLEITENGLKARQTQIHAPQKNFYAELHNKNWRVKALDIQMPHHQSLVRYTSIHSLSKADQQKIRNLINELIQKSRLIIDSSNEECASCLTIDFFSI